MRIFDAFPSTDRRQLARMLVRPRWFARFAWELISYLAWLVWNRRRPTVWNFPFSLVFAWSAPPPIPEQVFRFNAEREKSVRELKSSLDELRILVENAKRERAKEAELNLGAGKSYWRCAGCGDFFSDYSELENLGESIGHTRISESGPILCGPVIEVDLGDRV